MRNLFQSLIAIMCVKNYCLEILCLAMAIMPCVTVQANTESCDFGLPDPCAAISGCTVFDNTPFRLFRNGSRLNVGGYIEASIRANSHGVRSRYENGEHIPGNGDVFGGVNGSTNFNVNQLWFFAEREMDVSKGFDWGARLDMCFGMDGPNFWKSHDESFDYGWGTGDYGLGFNNLKMLFGYKKLTVQAGLYETVLGWEGPQMWDNFFMSGALVNDVMATSHLGFLAEYEVNDRLTIKGGWSNGYDNGSNRFDDSAFVGGFELQLTSRLSLAYGVSVDKMNDGRYRDGSFRYGGAESIGRVRGYVHSMDLCWNITDRFYWMCEWALSNIRIRNAGETIYESGYGLNNYFIYELNDKWSFGTRVEWFRDNTVSSDFNEVSLGLNWSPVERIKIRPELRYDWVCGPERPFADNTEKTQFSGGVSLFCRY